MKYLEPDEVPEAYRHLFLYDRQRVCQVYKNRTGLKIERLCVQCNNTYEVIVSQIRADFKRGRRMKGKCLPCRNDGIVANGGYIWLHMPEYEGIKYNDKYVPQHIFVMEKKLGRMLDRKNESVHHIDGDRSNNDISNLQLRQRFHGMGQAWECQDCGSNNVQPVAL